MADVLIKGMEMPTTCDDCILAEQGSWLGAQEGWEHFCTADCDELRTVYHGEKPDWCPLVEVPEHGRLIDADKLLKKGITLSWSVQKWMSEVEVGLMPTIIEASEEQDE